MNMLKSLSRKQSKGIIFLTITYGEFYISNLIKSLDKYDFKI